MTENMQKFLELVKQDEEMTVRLAALREAEPGEAMEQVIGLAKEKGLTLTAADFAAPEGELGDDDLEDVAGGFSFFITWFPGLFGNSTGAQNLKYAPEQSGAPVAETLEYRPVPGGVTAQKLGDVGKRPTPPGGVTLV